MGKSYSQLSLRERCQIEVLLEEGYTLRAIGRVTGRSASTISREFWRNGQKRAKRKGVYVADQAQTRATSRRRLDHRFKLARQPALLKYVADRLAMGWSPQQISGRLALEAGSPVISHESIYRYIYYRAAQKDWLTRLLPRKRIARRSWNKKPNWRQRIERRISVHDRPGPVNRREEAGHWEADLMLFSKQGPSLLVLQERISRMTFLKAMPCRTAAQTRDTIGRLISPLPACLRQSMTFDNGPEFYFHHHLTDQIGLQSYFCDIRSPWQKGGVENQIGRLRRYLPRKTNLPETTVAEIRQLQTRMNSTPRKCLDFKTPNEAFSELLSNVALQT